MPEVVMLLGVTADIAGVPVRGGLDLRVAAGVVISHDHRDVTHRIVEIAGGWVAARSCEERTTVWRAS